MPDDHPQQFDVAAYLLGTLEPDERARVEAHLEGCERCRFEAASLRDAVTLLQESAPPTTPPTGLGARTLLAVERAARADEPAPEPRPAPETRPASRLAPAPGRGRGRRGRGRLALALAGVAAVAAAGGVGLGIANRGPSGNVEIDAPLVAPGRPGTVGSVRVREAGIGRIVELRTSALPELDNTREFYEVWFAGAGHGPERPNAVSAGTFHPDPEGRSEVELTAAVVPRNYPLLLITREPRNGDPRQTGPVVLQAQRG